jgi:hypothetical protein
MTDIGKALINPASVFRAPRDVLTAEALSLEQKIEILRRWEYDARELQVAEEENMPGDDNGLFDEILLALHALGAGIDTTHSPPTKHGGV